MTVLRINQRLHGNKQAYNHLRHGTSFRNTPSSRLETGHRFKLCTNEPQVFLCYSVTKQLLRPITDDKIAIMVLEETHTKTVQ